MISEYWMWATWLTKVILYLSVAFVVGGAFCYFLLRQYLELKESILKYITIGAGLCLISSTSGFFILIGSFANTGITGMVDPTYINILVNTPTGYIYVLRSISFSLLLLLMVVKVNRNKGQFSIIESSIFCILLIPIIFSFSQLIINPYSSYVVMDRVFISVMENQPGNKWFTFKRSHACIWTYCCFHCWDINRLWR